MSSFTDWLDRYKINMGSLKDTLQYRMTWLEKYNAEIDAKQNSNGDPTVGSDGAAAGTAPGDSNEAKVWNFFASQGFAATAIAGIMGNLQQESNFSTTIPNPHSGAWGLGQWLGGRLNNLKSYAASQGKPADDIDIQINFLWNELNGGDSTTKSKMDKLYGGMTKFKQMGIHDAVVCYEDSFERSGGSALSTREKYANAWYAKWGTTGAPTGGSNSGVSDVSASGYFTLNGGHITPPGTAAQRKSYNSSLAQQTLSNNGANLVALPSDKFSYSGSSATGSGKVNKYFYNALMLIYNQMQQNNMLTGGKMKINSAYRFKSPETGAVPDPGAHGWGGAVDIGTNSLKQSVQLADICWGIGFRAIGVSNTFIHVDAGPYGIWSYGYGKYNGPGTIKA